MASLTPPASDLGVRLRGLRESVALTRAEAATCGGVSAETLKAWEAGRRTPRGPALDRLLKGLDVPSRERAALLARLDERYARIALMDSPHGTPVDHGTMLRAFRLRSGITQSEVARRAGVSQSAVAQWETGARILEGADLHQALFALGASGDEVAAILAAPHAPAGSAEDWIEAGDAADRLPGALRETAMLANERTLWWQATRKPEADVHLRRAMDRRAMWYALLRRFGEAEALLRHIHRMPPIPRDDPRAAGVANVLADVRYRPTSNPASLFRRLDHEAASPVLSPNRAWAMGTRAVALATMGELQAVALAKRAVEDARRMDHVPVEARFRRIDLAEVYFRLGDPERALEALGDDDLQWEYTALAAGSHPAGFWVRAQALTALGREPETTSMAALRAYVAKDGTPFYQNRLAGIERALAALRAKA